MDSKSQFLRSVELLSTLAEAERDSLSDLLEEVSFADGQLLSHFFFCFRLDETRSANFPGSLLAAAMLWTLLRNAHARSLVDCSQASTSGKPATRPTA